MAESDLKLNAAAFDACNRAIVISGCGRSGTTAIGQVIHSMMGVEYCFEGPTLVSLFAAMPTMPEAEWKLLYETYLYEEVLINALSGRNLNCNREDDSSIHKVKDATIINARLSISKTKNEAAAEARSGTIAYKVLDIAPCLKRLKSFYPDSRIVLLKRNAGDMINSILQKRWFSDESLQSGLSIWPNRMMKNTLVPYWVPQEKIDYWIQADQVNRAAYYCLFMMEAQTGLQDFLPVDYDKLVEKPHVVIESLASELGLIFGERTKEIIEGIAKRASPRVDVMSKLDPGIRQRLSALE